MDSEFEHPSIWYFFVGLLGLLLVVNVLALFGGSLRALLPLPILAAVLFFVWTGHRWVKAIVKLWAGLILVGAGFQVVGLLTALRIRTADALGAGLTLLVGLLVYVLADRYILTPDEVALRDAS